MKAPEWFLLGVIVSIMVFGAFMLFSSDLPRKGFFYVANEQNGWVVRMDNTNSNTTNITAPVATPEEAAKLANEFNHTLKGHEN